MTTARAVVDLSTIALGTTWTPTGNFGIRNSRTKVECACACGVVRWIAIRKGKLVTKACSTCTTAGNSFNRSHGHCVGWELSPTYKVWRSMQIRCKHPCVATYPIYGGRGISVCDRWIGSFENFLADMGERPSKDHQIDRINNDGNYEPSNCRWATRKEQGRNRRTNRLVEFGGETLCIIEWSERTGLHKDTIKNRLNNGWSAEAAITTPIDKRCLSRKKAA